MNAAAPLHESTRLLDVRVEDLVRRASAMADAGGRRILGIVGTPGSGKSTLCAALLDALGERAVLVGMDGFHLANQELVRLGRRDRKGAPDTFDVDGYATLLSRLREQTSGVIYAPEFDRSLEQPVGSAVAVSAEVPLVITEGNYLLYERLGWERVREHLDEAWYLDVPADVRRERLIARRRSFGHPAEEAETWVRDVDEVNAASVETTGHRADLTVVLASDPF